MPNQAGDDISQRVVDLTGMNGMSFVSQDITHKHGQILATPSASKTPCAATRLWMALMISKAPTPSLLFEFAFLGPPRTAGASLRVKIVAGARSGQLFFERFIWPKRAGGSPSAPRLPTLVCTGTMNKKPTGQFTPVNERSSAL
jgi:hypothetical protein